jgi:DNA-binding transcriptional MerR regulator
MTPSAGYADGLAIAAVSERLAIPVPTIRSWERRYGFPEPPRTRGKHRRYAAAEVDQLRQLRDAIAQGLPASEAVASVRARIAHPEPRAPGIDDLLRGAMDLDPGRLRAVLDGLEEELGLERALVDVVLPAMREVGARWKAGACDAANEHALTDAVRRWLARWTTLTPTSEHPPIVLSCGPKGMHTVGLEAFGLLLARRGWPVLTLGALTPVDALRHAVEHTRASAGVIVAQRGVDRRSTIDALDAIHPLLGDRTFFAGSAFAVASARRGVPGTYLGTDMPAAVDLVLESTSGRSSAITGAG